MARHPTEDDVSTRGYISSRNQIQASYVRCVQRCGINVRDSYLPPALAVASGHAPGMHGSRAELAGFSATSCRRSVSQPGFFFPTGHPKPEHSGSGPVSPKTGRNQSNPSANSNRPAHLRTDRFDTGRFGRYTGRFDW